MIDSSGGIGAEMTEIEGCIGSITDEDQVGAQTRLAMFDILPITLGNTVQCVVRFLPMILSSPLVQCPLDFVGRLLASKLLLGGRAARLRSDAAVRVSVKALALSCLAHVVALHPPVLFLPVFKPPPPLSSIAPTPPPQPPPPPQWLLDVLLFADHHDPQLRGQLSLVIGFLLVGGLLAGRGNFHAAPFRPPSLDAATVPLTRSASTSGAAVDAKAALVSLDRLIELLSTLLEDEASVTTRLTLVALKTCLPPLLLSCHSQAAVRLTLAALQLVSHPYWLIRVELLQLLAELDYAALSVLEAGLPALSRGDHRYLGALRLRGRVLDVVHRLACDEDPRVRSAAASTLTRLVRTIYYGGGGTANPSSSPSHAGDETTALHLMAETMAARHFQPFTYERLLPLPPLLHGTVYPYHEMKATTTTSSSASSSSSSASFSPHVEANLNRSIAALTQLLKVGVGGESGAGSGSRHCVAGVCLALRCLVEEFPTTTYSTAWSLGVSFCSANAASSTAAPPAEGRARGAAVASSSSLAPPKSRALLSGSYCHISWDEELFSQLGSKLTSGAGSLQVRERGREGERKRKREKETDRDRDRDRDREGEREGKLGINSLHFHMQID